MDGIHDLGGMHGFGRVVMEKDEPPFHAHWEAVMFALNLAAVRAGAVHNTDRFRHAIERIDPVSYLNDTYYGRWLGGIETLLVEAGLVTQDEITARSIAGGAPADARIAARPSASPDPIGPPSAGRPATRAIGDAPGFEVGDDVITRVAQTPGHTRLPRYARGRRGRIARQYGGWVFPDTNAHGLGEQPVHLYSVEFAGDELWGEGAEKDVVVHLDLFEPYLGAAGKEQT